MKRIIAIGIILSATIFHCYSQKNAAEQTLKEDTAISVKSKNANFLMKSEKLNYGIWIDQNKWKFKKDLTQLSKEYEFSLNGGEDVYAVFMTEKIEIPTEQLKKIAFVNAIKVSSKTKIVKQEVRKVNGLVLYSTQMNCTIDGMQFIYLSYYYSCSKGTIGFVTHTSPNLFLKYQTEMESLLNGLVEITL